MTEEPDGVALTSMSHPHNKGTLTGKGRPPRPYFKGSTEMVEIQTTGHNGIAAAQLQNIVGRIERLEEERKALSADIKDIYTEAKSAGFDVKALRALITERRQDANAAEERRALLDLYRDALGQLAETPLGVAALGKA